MRRREFELVVVRAIAELPLEVRRALDDVAVIVEAAPSRELMREAGLRHADDLFGWYEGTPLTERSVAFGMAVPDRIVLFQRPLERACRNRRELIEQIGITLRHEVGHYLGMDEADMEPFGLA